MTKRAFINGKYYRGKLNASGTEMIKEVFRKYDIQLLPKANYEVEEIKLDGEAFRELLLRIPTEYVAKKNYEMLKKKNEELEKQAQEQYKEYWEKKFENFEGNLKEITNNTINNAKAQFRVEKCELENRIQELESKVKKWQAMYTGQAEANAILVRKLEANND